MVARLAQPDYSVLVSEGDWAWVEALREIFRPRAVNLLVAHRIAELVSVIESRRIHTAIVDMDWSKGHPSQLPVCSLHRAGQHCQPVVAQQGLGTGRVQRYRQARGYACAAATTR